MPSWWRAIPGPVAQLLDSLTVTPGYEQALGAALADDLRAPLADGGSGWVSLPDYTNPAALPEAAAPLVPHVTGGPVLARRLSQVGLVAPEEGAALQPRLCPGQRLVTRGGDLWRWDGLHVAAQDATSTTALRLEQRNRLAALHAELARAEQAARASVATHDDSKARLDELTKAERQARGDRDAAEAQRGAAARESSRVAAARDLARSQSDAAQAQADRARTELADLSNALDDLRRKQAAVSDPAQARARLEALAARVSASREACQTARAQADGLRRDGTARAARMQEIAKSLNGWRARLATASARVADLAGRRQEADRRLATARDAPPALAEKRAALQHEMTRAEARATAADDALKAGESAARAAAEADRAAESAHADARETRARAEAGREAAQGTADSARARIADTLDCTPQALLDELALDPATLPEPAQLEAELTRLRRARDALGAVNLRAEEDARAVQSEHDTLVREKDDLDAAIAKLRAAIAALNREGRERLLAAFDKVNGNFANLFQHLFSGGEARWCWSNPMTRWMPGWRSCASRRARSCRHCPCFRAANRP